MAYDPVRDELSPDGRTLVRWAESDGRMSHVIRTPHILDAASGETILRCRDSARASARVLSVSSSERLRGRLRRPMRPRIPRLEAITPLLSSSVAPGCPSGSPRALTVSMENGAT
jgi:hypothetical protein